MQTAEDYETAMALLDSSSRSFDLIFADIVLPGRYTGLDLLNHARSRKIDCPIIMITGQPEIETAAMAVRNGAFDYVPKPVRRDTLLRLARSALKFQRMKMEKRQIEKEKEQVRRHMEAVFNSVGEAIVTVDRQGRILSANPAAGEICGISPDKAAGRELGSVDPVCREKCGRIIDEALNNGRPAADVRVECVRNGDVPKLVAVNCSELQNGEGRQKGAVLVIRDITRIHHLEKELRERKGFGVIVGKSEAMQKVYRLLEDLADLDTTVLITGESGTGKELIADALHTESLRSAGPLVKVNCSALSENLLESELFGHVKGAFTGAAKDKAGRFEMAGGGTIFLDEIGDISPAVQLKLLRVLQEKEIERVGDSRTRKVDVRVVSATNQDLRAKIQQGHFREDLYYRLKVMEVHLPALRHRRQDIPVLMDHFRRELNAGMNRQIENFSDEVTACCMQYEWPGNVRELKHSLEHAFVLCRDPELRLKHLPLEIRPAAAPDPVSPLSGTGRGETLKRDAIVSALEHAGWNKAKAARLLNVSRQTLYRKLKEFGIPAREPKNP